ncbi:hypothetical protein AMTR_s00096p00152730 [Amborella trichopoda]|uniref:Uncharacterized protein n=1 Tax=Amborella trichopoda TaxID=13333 RepID=W1P636_AMBTC|nr:hypothetical protein AMTR_s00096p00152730 [Amborella trichopoda]
MISMLLSLPWLRVETSLHQTNNSCKELSNAAQSLSHFLSLADEAGISNERVRNGMERLAELASKAQEDKSLLAKTYADDVAGFEMRVSTFSAKYEDLTCRPTLILSKFF